MSEGTTISETKVTVSDAAAQRSLETAYPGTGYPAKTHDKRRETPRESTTRKGSSR